MAMIEAMLAGKAIVASDAGGIRELLPGTDVGLLVPPSDAGALAAALGDLVREPALRERLGAAARVRALAHFTASAMADRYLALYAASGP
jgi:glycosyltransferase involved in cell wall biosynthesis